MSQSITTFIEEVTKTQTSQNFTGSFEVAETVILS
jgi:hypothetical protein